MHFPSQRILSPWSVTQITVKPCRCDTKGLGGYSWRPAREARCPWPRCRTLHIDCMAILSPEVNKLRNRPEDLRAVRGRSELILVNYFPRQCAACRAGNDRAARVR